MQKKEQFQLVTLSVLSLAIAAGSTHLAPSTLLAQGYGPPPGEGQGYGPGDDEPNGPDPRQGPGRGPGQGQGGPGQGMGPGGPLPRALAQLNLTTEQQAKIKAIMDEEHQRTQQRISALLTPEQKERFEQLMPATLASVKLPPNRVSITVEGAYRFIRSNGIPDHPTGAFPNNGNPSAIRAQNYNFRVPAKPQVAAATSEAPLGPVGVAVNGVPFDPGANEFWNNDRNSGWQYEPLSGQVNMGLDANIAHVQPNGAYHYHGLPSGLLANLKAAGKMTLVGWADDGFPMYAPLCFSRAQDATSTLRPMTSSFRLKKGARPANGPGGDYDGTYVQDYEYVAGLGDLDECNGRTGVTPEFPNGTYYYVLSNSWPVIPRRFRGTPDRSIYHGPRGGRPLQGTPGQGPGGGPDDMAPPFGPPEDGQFGPPPFGPPPFGPPPFGE